MFYLHRRFRARFTCCIIVIILIAAISLVSQASARLQPTEVNAQWGYINQSGEVVVGHQFERAGDFVDGFAAVRIQGKEGYIDIGGKTGVTPQFDWAGDFSDKLARFNLGGTWNGSTVSGGKWGYIDQAGKIVIEAQFEDAQDFAEGLAAIQIDGKWGYIDKTGKVIIKPRYNAAWKFSQSLALVRGSSYSYINPLGKTIIEPQKVSDWSEVPGHFSEDLARVKIRDKWGYIDRRGNIVIATEYDSVTDFEDSMAAVQFERRWGFINKKGAWVIEPRFDWADRFYGDRAIVQMDGKYGFIDRTGKLVIPAQYAEVTHFSEGLAAVKTIDGWGYIDPLGNFVINPLAKKALSFSGGLAATRLGPGWGYVNDKNKFVIAPKFDWAGDFSEELAFVLVDGLYGCINPAGQWVVMPRYAGYSSFKDGTALVSTGKWDPGTNIYIDSTGNIVQQFADHLQQYCRNTEHLLKENLSVLAPDGLKVYQEPDLNAEEMGLIPYGTQIQVVEHTFEPVELEGIKGHWVAVNYNDEAGFIFDGFLSRLEAPALGAGFLAALGKFTEEKQEAQLWYDPDHSMRVWVSPSGIIQALSGREAVEADRWDIYIPGISLREAFLLVRSLANEQVIRLNGQPVAEGTFIKDIPFLETNGRIVIETAGTLGFSDSAYQIVIEKERLGYIHIYFLYDEYSRL